MSNSIIEDSRQISEDLDLFESNLTKLLLNLDDEKSKTSTITHRNKLIILHKSNDLINRIVNSSQLLKVSNSLENEERLREIDALTGNSGGGSIINQQQQTTTTTGSDLSEFYQRLGKVKEYHRKYPEVASNTIKSSKEVDFTALEGGDEEWLDKKFTSEEGLGRYLDLHESHELWNSLAPISASGTINSGGWKRLTYLQYLEVVTSFNLSPSLKSTSEYSKYLTQLLEYLSNFYEKVFPLGDLDSLLSTADSLFAKKWEMGTVNGWPKLEENKDEVNNETPAEEGIWCSACKFHLMGRYNNIRGIKLTRFTRL